MEIIKRYSVPTGDILVVNGECGLLECISVGDYGKQKNVKADFLGLTREINGVPHGGLTPLEEKWVITISTQYGCRVGCRFCDVPKVGSGKNASAKDMFGQVLAAIEIHKEIKSTKRLNLHFARMGEPTFNNNIFRVLEDLIFYFKNEKQWPFHPVLSTMMPCSQLSRMIPFSHIALEDYIDRWLQIKNILNGEAGLQISVNSTSEEARNFLFNKKQSRLEDIASFDCFKRKIFGRKIALNFALSGHPIDATKLVNLFDPEKFMCKLTPMHMTKSCQENDLKTAGGYEHFYPYKQVEEDLKKVGYDVIVFVPSIEEDLGLITCGNAVLSGSIPQCR